MTSGTPPHPPLLARTCTYAFFPSFLTALWRRDNTSSSDAAALVARVVGSMAVDVKEPL